MEWHAHIGTDPDVLVGKPAVRGTRLSVEFLLDLFAAGWSREQVLQGYPHLAPAALAAVFAFAADAVRAAPRLPER